ncbi:MAG: cysteine desulfurase family protein [Planctomycetota bacterium]
MTRARLYLDHNATSPMPEVAIEAMMPFFRELSANPSSRHEPGEHARVALENARAQIAATFGARPAELTFTSGATESINWAIRGVLASRPGKMRIVTSVTEHPVSLDIVDRLEREGYEVLRLPVDGDGVLDPGSVAAALNDDTALLSLIGANNETGVRFDIDVIGELARSKGVPFHVDAVQLAGKEPQLMRDHPIDLLSFGGHKFGASKGVGGLIVRRGTRIRPLFWGGHQEGGKRSGTENLASVVGMAVALDYSHQQWAAHAVEIGRQRDRLQLGLQSGVQAAGEKLLVNGGGAPRIENTLNVCFHGIEGIAIVLTLSQKGIDVSSGSACSASDPGPSPVLLGMGVPNDYIHGAVRFSLAPGHSESDIDFAIEQTLAAWNHVRRVNT